MSGAAAFLEKLKLTKGPVQETSVSDDAEGYRVVIVERRFLTEPIDRLGIRLTADAQVENCDPDGPCRRIPKQYFVVYVNNEFVDTSDKFYSLAQKDLRLVVKIYNGSAMEELLARMLNDTNDELDHRALFETTPRYAFLATDHPMFMRWNVRHQQSLESKRILRSVAEQAEEQAALESLKAIQEAAQRAEEEEAERLKEEEEQRKARERVEELRRRNAPKRLDEVVLEEKPVASSGQGLSCFEDAATPDRDPAVAQQDDPTAESIVIPPSTLGENDVSSEELLRIVSGNAFAAATTPDNSGVAGGGGSVVAATPLSSPPLGSVDGAPDAEELRSILFGTALPPLPATSSEVPQAKPEPPNTTVQLQQRFKRPYVLSNGVAVDVVIKERKGPKPQPPTKDPPRTLLSTAASVSHGQPAAPAAAASPIQSCHYCHSTEHVEELCHVKRAESKRWLAETDRLKEQRDREVCRDFRRGQCVRKPCPFLHEVDATGGDRGRKRSRSDDRQTRRESSRRRSHLSTARSRSRSRRRDGRSEGRNHRSHSHRHGREVSRSRDRRDRRDDSRDRRDRRDDHRDNRDRRRDDHRDDRKHRDDRRGDRRSDRRDEQRDHRRDDSRVSSGRHSDRRRDAPASSSKAEWSRANRRL